MTVPSAAQLLTPSLLMRPIHLASQRRNKKNSRLLHAGHQLVVRSRHLRCDFNRVLSRDLRLIYRPGRLVDVRDAVAPRQSAGAP